MATVTFRQATNMAALPTALPSASSIQSSVEIDVAYELGLGQSASLNCLGAFTGNNHDMNLQGNISQVMIDDGDLQSFPNLDITGLSFHIDQTYFFTVML